MLTFSLYFVIYTKQTNKKLISLTCFHSKYDILSNHIRKQLNMYNKAENPTVFKNKSDNAKHYVNSEHLEMLE